MSYDRACELLGFTTPKGLGENARLARLALSTMAPGCPLRYRVAAAVLIRAAEDAEELGR